MAAAPCHWRFVVASDNEQKWEAHILNMHLYSDPDFRHRLDGPDCGKGVDGDLRNSDVVFDGRSDTKWVTKGGADKLGTWVGYSLKKGAWVQGIRTEQWSHPGNTVPSFDVQYSPDGQTGWRTFWTASGLGCGLTTASRKAGQPLPSFTPCATREPLATVTGRAPKCWRFRVAADNEQNWEAHVFEIQLFSDYNMETRLSSFVAGQTMDGGSRNPHNNAGNVFDSDSSTKWETKFGKEKIGTWAGVTLTQGAWVNSIKAHQFGHPGNTIPVFDVQYSPDEDPEDPLAPSRPWNTYWTASGLAAGWSSARRDAAQGPPPRFVPQEPPPPRFVPQEPHPKAQSSSGGHGDPAESRAIALAREAPTTRMKLGGAHLSRIVDSRLLNSMQTCFQTNGEWLGQGRDCRGHAEKYSRLVLEAAWQIQHPVELGRYDLAKQEIQDHLECLSGAFTPVHLSSSTWPSALDIRVDTSLNECLLVHGTKPESLSAVLSSGLNERYSSSGGLFGAGSYLADDAGKADQYCTVDASQQDNALHQALFPDGAEHPGNICYLLLCKVLLGQTAVTLDARELKGGGSLWANSERRELAAVPNSDPPFNYHSLVAETGQVVKRYKEYVVFHSDRILASYLMAYRRVA